MFYYKNVSSSEKTFHGVTFQPGEIKQVKKYINSKWMVLIEKEAFEKKRNKQQKHSSDQPKNPVPEQKPVGKEENKEEAKIVPKEENKEAPHANIIVPEHVEQKKEEHKEDKKEQKGDQPKQEEKKENKPEQKS